MNKIFLLLIIVLTACGKGKRGQDGTSIVGPEGPQGESIVGPKGDKGDKGDQGEPGRDLKNPSIEKVSLFNGVDCSGEYTLPTLAPTFYFIQDGNFTRMLRQSDDGVERSWPTPSNGPIHKSSIFYKTSSDASDIQIKEVSLWITRASGCGFIFAQENVVSETLE